MSIEPARLVTATWAGPVQFPASCPDAADVVIVGGGIVGVSAAWCLARRGISVVLCEKGYVAGEQSGRNWGWVRVQGRDPREVPMMLDSMSVWRSLAGEIGEDVGYTAGGCLYVARTEQELAEYERWMPVAREHGLPTRMLTRREIEPLTGAAAAMQWVGGQYTETDGRAEPHLAGPAIARAAARAGAAILTGCAVRGLETAGGRVVAVVTEHGRIRTSTVLCAAGAWSSLFCRSLGITLPQLRVRGTVVRTAPRRATLAGNLFDQQRLGIRRRSDGGYTVAHGTILDHPITPSTFRHALRFLPALRQEWRVLRLSFGREFFEELRMPSSWELDEVTPFERQRVLDPAPDPKVVDGIRRQLDATLPELEGVEFVEAWAGMVETVPDVVPVIGPVDALPGFYLATGFSGHGFGLGPGAGRAAAALLAGDEPAVDLAPFRLSRFFDGSPIQLQSSI